jgi:hypothetical protein
MLPQPSAAAALQRAQLVLQGCIAAAEQQQVVISSNVGAASQQLLGCRLLPLQVADEPVLVEHKWRGQVSCRCRVVVSSDDGGSSNFTPPAAAEGVSEPGLALQCVVCNTQVTSMWQLQQHSMAGADVHRFSGGYREALVVGASVEAVEGLRALNLSDITAHLMSWQRQ